MSLLTYGSSSCQLEFDGNDPSLRLSGLRPSFHTGEPNFYTWLKLKPHPRPLLITLLGLHESHDAVSVLSYDTISANVLSTVLRSPTILIVRPKACSSRQRSLTMVGICFHISVNFI